MTIKVNPNTCPKCGVTIPSDAPQGLCPKCVLLGAATSTEAGLSPAATAEIPSLERVAAAFPQLEIVELLGHGGMGFVFKARQPQLDRFVALKLLPDKLARDAHFAERFSREARMLARLNHPGIVTIYDFGLAGGFYFLLMEYVDGVNLRQAMQAGRFSAAAALALVPKICEALQFAHEQGVLHRDIKPANILLDTRGRVKIADFGIAKLVGEEKPDLNLTATGASVGTPAYMAPEQLETPGTVDHRADIYSLGVVFYEMLTGELPIGRFSPPSQRTPLDPRVDEVVMRTLEKEREKRYQSAGEVKTKVEHLTEPQVAAAAATPAFDPSQDFILCPPRLPRMAKAVIVYALVVAPLLWLVSLFTLEPLPDHALIAFIEGTVNLFTTAGELLVLVVLAVGGWKLRGLRSSAPTWLKCALWSHLILIVLAIVGYLWVGVLEVELLPNAPTTQLNIGDGLMLAIALASLIFEISALVWLRRNGALLKSLCPPPAPRRGRQGTAVLGAAGGGVSKWSRAASAGKWIFAAVLLALLGSVITKWPQTVPTTRHLSSAASATNVTLAVSAPPRETLIITGIVLSNGVALSGELLRAKLWPPSGLKPSPFIVEWKLAADAHPDDVPWDIVIEDATANTIAARLRPPQLPRLDWTVSPSAANLGKLSATREARNFEVARALQASDGVHPAVDWSVRIQLQSSPHSTTSSRGIKADFELPANQVATFELVTRSNGVIVLVPELAAYQINGTPEPYIGKFILADDPDELDSLTGLPRWTFGIIGPDGRLTSQGLAVPPVPSDFNLTLQSWLALQPDQEVVAGLPDATSGRQRYGLRMRTQTVKLKPGLLHSSSGYGTNWMPAVARDLESATTATNPPVAWIQFTFTAVELREVAGKRWLAIDYLDQVHGDCEKSFPWETKIPGFKAEVRTSEFAKDPSDPAAPRHQRIEYLLPDAPSRDQLEQLRSNVEQALKHKTIRLKLGEQKSLFEFGSSSDTALKAWIKVGPPLKL